MITKTLSLKVNSRNALHVAFDVGKSSLDLYFEVPHALQATFQATSSRIPNKPPAILRCLEELGRLAQINGFDSLFITCESTGAYSEKLLRLARQKGHFTAYVSGESVHKLKVVENNDAGKTDTKDPRVIHMLSRLDKVLRHRSLSGPYLALREFNRAYDEERTHLTSIKGQCHPIIARLFCDLEFTSQFLYQKTGQALFELFRFNPVKILAAGQLRFEKSMRKQVPGVRWETLHKLWDNAKSSCLLYLEEGYQEAMEYRLEGLWARKEIAEKRLQEIHEKMEGLYNQLVEAGEKVPHVSPGFLSAFRIARLLGETGPLADFPDANRLLRFAGLNLRERKSGQYTGEVHISKKGRSTLRRVLGETSFGMVKKKAAYGPYYHAKKAKGMVGSKILAAVERKLLRTFFALGIKCIAFDPGRLSQCESQFKQVA